jgi:hypothetical protein
LAGLLLSQRGLLMLWPLRGVVFSFVVVTPLKP